MSYDVIVVGLGAMGSATLYQLAKRGIKVLGIDRFSPPHDQGSTHGETRITRRAIGEGVAYVPLAVRSHEIWRELEAETGKELLAEIGSIIISREDDVVRPGRTGFIKRTLEAARAFSIEHEVLSAEEARRRHPHLLVGDDEMAYFEPGGGFLRVENCISANLEMARKLGAETLLDTQVLAIADDGAGVAVTTSAGVLHCAQVAVSAGGWAAKLLGEPYAGVLKPTRQVMHWFGVQPDLAEAWRASPVFMWPHGESEDGFFYGFPMLDGHTMKTADEFYGAASDPDSMDRMVSAADSEKMFNTHLAGRLAGLERRAQRTATCIYTATPDSVFVIERHVGNDRMMVVSPCSGHGFKHSAAIGEAVAQVLVDGESRIDLSPFSSARLQGQAEG